MIRLLLTVVSVHVHFHLNIWPTTQHLQKMNNISTDNTVKFKRSKRKKLAITNMKSTTSFQMILSAIIALCKSPKERLKISNSPYSENRYTSVIMLNKVTNWCIKNTTLCVKTLSREVVCNSFAFLMVHKWLTADVVYNL